MNEPVKKTWDIRNRIVTGRTEEDGYRVAKMIYEELPVLVSRVANGALARIGSLPGTILMPEDEQFVNPYLDEMERVFHTAVSSKRKEIEELLKRPPAD